MRRDRDAIQHGMRSASVVLSVVALGACGRFGFDAVGSGGSDSCTGSACTTVPMDAPDVFDAPRGDPGVDSDGDTVFDDTDNCIMVANTSQHDEDSDGYGDACDNCPTVPNTSQANVRETNAGATADSVGDACDPRPTQGGDAFQYIDLFDAATLGADWSVIRGSWSIAADAVEQPSLASDQRIHDPFAAGTSPDYIVESTFTWTGFDTGNVNAGVIYRMSGNNGWLCAVFRDDTTQPVTALLMLWTLQNGSANFERSRATIVEPVIGARYRILGGAYGSNQYCALDSFQTGPTAPFTSNQNASGIPGLRTNRVSGTYASFVVYSLGGPIQ